jgi:thymidylate kinase
MEVNVSNKLIFFEGPDGVGKTQVLTDMTVWEDCALFDRDTREPWNHAILDLAADADPTTQALLFIADRSLHMRQVAEWLEDDHIICDRGPLSTLVYQGSANGMSGNVDLDWLIELNNVAMNSVSVSHTIIFYAPFDTICRRIEGREKPSMTDREREELFRAWGAYEAIRRDPAKYTHSWTGELLFIDADRPYDVVYADVEKTVMDILKKGN